MSVQNFGATPMARVGWALRDAGTLAVRVLAHWKRRPGSVLTVLLFPVMILLVFGLLFGGAMRAPGGGSYVDFLVPGMFAMTMLFGLEGVVVAVTHDSAKGVIERFRSMPMASSAVVLGRGAADMLNAVVGLAVMVGAGLLAGWSADNGLVAALGAVGLLLWLRFAFVWIGIYLGLVLKTPESAVSVQILVWPVGFLSSAFVSPSTMPAWLGTIAAWNPMSSTATAVRELFGNPGWQAETWVAQNAVLMAVAWPALLTVVFLPLAVRRYRRLSR